MQKKVILIIAAIAVVIGGFFGIKFQVRNYEALKATYVTSVRLVDFIQVEFPDQIKDYSAKLQQKQAGAPATTTPVAVKSK